MLITRLFKNCFSNYKPFCKNIEPIFITHIQAHSGLPGVMAQGNKTANHLAMPIFKSPDEEHAELYTTSCCLHVNYMPKWKQARQMIDKCTISTSLNKRIQVAGANPRFTVKAFDVNLWDWFFLPF